MKLGVVYPQTELGGDPGAVARVARAAEAMGYDHVVAYDHVVGAHPDRQPPPWGPYTHEDPFHDPLVMFGYLAGVTERIELVAGVLVLPQRQTALVARQCADVDLLSGGRFRLGVGVGWNKAEYDALGQRFSSRGRRLDEQIPLLRRLWTEPLVAWTGEVETFDRVAVLPRPARPIPVWVGGFGPAAFRRGVTLGDGFVFSGSVERCVDAWTDLRQDLARSGRDPAAFGAELIIRSGRTVSEVVDRLGTWQEAGGTHASVASMGRGFTTADEHVGFFAEVVATA